MNSYLQSSCYVSDSYSVLLPLLLLEPCLQDHDIYISKFAVRRNKQHGNVSDRDAKEVG